MVTFPEKLNSGAFIRSLCTKRQQQHIIAEIYVYYIKGLHLSDYKENNNHWRLSSVKSINNVMIGVGLIRGHSHLAEIKNCLQNT